MSNGELFEEIKEMLESDDMTLKQGMRLLLAAFVQQHENKKFEDKETVQWRSAQEKRLDVLESRDQRIIAKWGAIGVMVGAAISGVAIIVVAVIS